jgi:hypothetical protein
MYGLINQANQELATIRLGEGAWKAICLKTNADPSFVTMATYPDEVTYKLVGAVSEALGLRVDTFLEQLGEYWTVYTAEAGYGPLLQFAGDNVFDFLRNLDNMHARVALAFPKLEPPRAYVCTTARRGRGWRPWWSAWSKVSGNGSAHLCLLRSTDHELRYKITISSSSAIPNRLSR